MWFTPLGLVLTLYSTRASLTFPVYRLQRLPGHLTASISLPCLIVLHSTYYLLLFIFLSSDAPLPALQGFPCAAFTVTSLVPRTMPDTWQVSINGGLGTGTAQTGRSHPHTKGGVLDILFSTSFLRTCFSSDCHSWRTGLCLSILSLPRTQPGLRHSTCSE